MTQLNPQDQSQIIFYTTPDQDLKIDVYFVDETVWLTQKRMSKLFGVEVNTINYHVKETYKSRELSQEATIRSFRIVQREGNRDVERDIDFYSLDMIISVGYRVNSQQATQFRIWATKTLRDYIIKGFVLDEDRLKNGNHFGKDYFQELLEKIREIRASERMFYQKITDLFACSYDYDSRSQTCKDFFATVQNKLHWAITKHTAAELISERADSKKTNMGLTTWRNSPKGKILKSDVTIAKNYLSKPELEELNRIVTMYLDYAENQAKKGIVMNMASWSNKLDAFLEFNEYEILSGTGSISAKIAKKLAIKEFDEFRVIQDQKYESDFDKFAQKQLNKTNQKQS